MLYALTVTGGSPDEVHAMPLAAKPAAAAPLLSARDLLELYDHGEYDRVVADLSARQGVLDPHRRRVPEPIGTFAADLKRTSAQWILSGNSVDVLRRRLVVATLAIEAAHVMPGVMARLDFDIQFDDRLGLLQWAAALLTTESNPQPRPLPAERWWWLAASAALQGFGPQPMYHAGLGLFAQAKARFPADEELQLEEAIFYDRECGILAPAIERRASPHFVIRDLKLTAVESSNGAADVEFPGVPDPPPSTGTAAVDTRVVIRNAIRALSALRDDPTFGPEAQLRLGALELYLNEPDLAVPHLEVARKTLGELDLRYLATFFLGSARARQDQVAPAEASFRDALSLIPRTASATIALEWLYAATGRQQEATALAADRLAHPAGVSDPLVMYRSGDARRWSTFVAELRRGLRP